MDQGMGCTKILHYGYQPDQIKIKGKIKRNLELYDDALAELSEAGRKLGEGLAKAGIKEKDISSIGGISGLKNVIDNIEDDDKKRIEKNRMIFFFIILAIIGVILAL